MRTNDWYGCLILSHFLPECKLTQKRRAKNVGVLDADAGAWYDEDIFELEEDLMELLLSALRELTEYETIRKTLRRGRCVGVSGAGQINRSHLIAGLYRDLDAPMLVLCQDELACRRTQEELAAFLGTSFPILPSRELTFYDTSAASRQWEQKRLRLLYRMVTGEERLVIASFEALSLRTLPHGTLLGAAIDLRPG